MRVRGLIYIAVVVASTLSFGDDGSPDPFRVVVTPTGCAVIMDKVPDEYRVDTLADGAVVIGLPDSSLPSQEKEMKGTCLEKYRVLSSYGGAGSSLELSPKGFEFCGVIRSKSGLQIVFEKVVSLGAGRSGEPAASRSYRLGAGDVIKITVFNHEDLTKESLVGPDGKISYTLVGDVQVAGRTAREVQDELTTLLGKNYIVNPQISVEVKTYDSQFVYVNGPVKSPGRWPLQGGLTLKDAIALAGGFGPDAGYSIVVARKHDDGQGSGPENIRFGRKDIDVGLANLELLPGDVVTVSEKDWVYISSEVREPGKYELGPGLTLLRAIAVAKGLTDWADTKRVALIRVVGGQTIRETINLKDIERQKAPDIPLVAGDQIIVPRRIL